MSNYKQHLRIANKNKGRQGLPALNVHGDEMPNVTMLSQDGTTKMVYSALGTKLVQLDVFNETVHIVYLRKSMLEAALSKWSD